MQPKSRFNSTTQTAFGEKNKSAVLNSEDETPISGKQNHGDFSDNSMKTLKPIQGANVKTVYMTTGAVRMWHKKKVDLKESDQLDWREEGSKPTFWRDIESKTQLISKPRRAESHISARLLKP